MVETDDMNTPEKHEPDEFSPPDEYVAGGERGGEPRGFSLQFDDDERDSWNYDDEYRRKKDLDEEEEDYLKDEEGCEAGQEGRQTGQEGRQTGQEGRQTGQESC